MEDFRSPRKKLYTNNVLRITTLRRCPSDDDDDRLQLLRALVYLAWGISSGSMTGKDVRPEDAGGADHYYAISAGE